ncbi:unnamed protein product [Effrenium voratum]|nr:unnamed protein product [Effrenium voratum]
MEPPAGWVPCRLFGALDLPDQPRPRFSQARIECEREALPWLRKALRQRQQIKELLTESNVHAAWLMASMKLAAAKAKSLTSWALRQLLRPFLPPPKAASPYVQANGEGNSSRLDPK